MNDNLQNNLANKMVNGRWHFSPQHKSGLFCFRARDKNIQFSLYKIYGKRK